MKSLISKCSLVGVSIFVVGSLLAGCGSKDADKTEEVKKEDKQVIKNVWEDATIEGTPKRIATLDFSFSDELSALGISPVAVAGVGTTEVPSYLEDKVKDYVYVGDRSEPNLELIRSAKPDLIIANPDRHKLLQKDLPQIAPTIALDDNTYEEVLQNVHLLGDITRKQAEAEKAEKELKDRIESIKGKIQNNPTVLVSGSFEDDFHVWVKQSFVGSLLTAVGFTYPLNDSDIETKVRTGKVETGNLGVEAVAEINPDYIFDFGDEVNQQKWASNPIFKNLKAVKEGHYVSVDRNIWSRGRGVQAAHEILDQIEKVVDEKQ
ncbi:ABC transporter substrate-binding protein [Bacillus sp. 03113]|uniref:ABC transporter substrate-binding protein n=1 Tax=Bacillus sp. 03113 TaxID=2578211 RepID=UPI00114493ED|nr:iron-siderophore ABC transporter substrate-binding protein [Bacillus sp. 03113]